MKKLLFIILTICVLGITQHAEAVLIDYDGAGNSLTEIGSYYSGLDGSPTHSSGFMWLLPNPDLPNVYGPHSSDTVAFSLDTNPVSVDWAQDVAHVSLWYGLLSPDVVPNNSHLYVQGYNNSSLIFDSGFLTPTSSGMIQYIAPDVDIDSLVFDGLPNYWTMDDLYYEVSEQPPIPEPMTLALLGSGLIGLVSIKKKKVA